MGSALTNEQRRIVECLKATNQRASERWSNDSVDWDRFADLAIRYGLGPLTFARLASSYLDVSPDALSRLRHSYAFSLFRSHATLAPILRETIGALHAAGLEPILLKGGALAYVAYDRPEHRTLSDIDLLLPREQLELAGETLRSLGFTIAEVVLEHGHHHLPPYISPDGQMAVELHHHILDEASPYDLDVCGLCARAEVRTIAGSAVRVLAPPDALLHVCLHLSYGHRYQWYSLRALMDILVLTTCPEQMDWDVLLTTCLTSQLAGAVYWPLRLSRDWLDAPVPDSVLARLAPNRSLRWAMEPVLDSAYVLDGRVPEGLGSNVLYSLVRELSLYTGCSFGQQLSAVWRCLFPSPDRVTHLPEQVRRSSIRYAVELGDPRRGLRGGLALWRLLSGRVHAPENRGDGQTI